ncbi:MAG: hypothetical protein A07HB70_01893, partial [uncultured archaeon A07HB70]
MSRTVSLDPHICRYCGCYTEDEDQRCSARDDG